MQGLVRLKFAHDLAQESFGDWASMAENSEGNIRIIKDILDSKSESDQARLIMSPAPEVKVAIRIVLNFPAAGINPGMQHVHPATGAHQQVKKISEAEFPDDSLQDIRLAASGFQTIPETDGILHRKGAQSGNLIGRQI